MVLQEVGHRALQGVAGGGAELQHHLQRGGLGAVAAGATLVHAVGLEGQLEGRGDSRAHLLREGLDVGVVVLGRALLV